VEKTTKGPQVILSRTDPALLMKLFEMEVPEIYDGTVVIKVAARDTGERSKIAVSSKDKDVDPVGACVGMKGSRVQAIIRELHGEKIDIIPYSEDSLTFVMNSLSPAKISRASIVDSAERVVEVIVETDQLSLAIGKKGQNVRLACKLTGWRIDIKSDEEKRAEVENQMAQMAARTSLTELPDLTAGVIEKLSGSGINCIEELADTPIGALTQIKGIGPKSAEKIIASVKDYYMQFSEPAEAEPAESPVAAVSAEETSPNLSQHTEPPAGSSTAGEETQDSNPQMQTESQNDIKG
jgi:N utilization substance protein A